jgi:Lamin Tail Domain
MRLPYVATAALTAALAVAAVVIAPAADASSAVRLGKIQYNSPGSDTGSNASLNAEFVTITNHAAKRRTLTGWTLRDASHHVYRFPTFSLGSGASVRVHTGNGSNGAHDLYWRSSSYIWNNTGDKAILRNGAGTTLDTCSWGSGTGTVSC